MANVKICDRCGAQLERNCFMTFVPVRYILSIETHKRFMGEHYDSISEYDLCKNCAAELHEFLKGKVVTNESN